MGNAENIFAKIPEPEFWAAPLLQEIRTGWQQETGAFNPDPALQDTGINAGIVPMSEDPALELSIRQEVAAEQALDRKDAIKQIEWLLSIMTDFHRMLKEDPGHPDDDMYWAFAQNQGSGRRSDNEGRAFLKHWLRFICDHFGHGPFRIGKKDRGSLMRTGKGEPSEDQILEGMNPAMRLGFLTAKTKFPNLSHRDVTQVVKDNAKNVPWSVDPNGGKVFSPE